MKRESCKAVVACTDDVLHLPAAYLASRLVGARFYPYLFDNYAYKWLEPLDRSFARRVEAMLMRGATTVICPNEYLSDDLHSRFGIEPLVIHNGCDLEEPPSNVQPRMGADEFVILYTGDIYAAHYDAFRNLLAAIDLLGQPSIKLHIYSTRRKDELEGKGIRGAIVWHRHQSLASMHRTQKEADLLYLPLAFNSPYPEVIKTSAPAKMGEYLSAGRPILVHAPSDSFVAQYFRNYLCGLVVARSDPTELAQSIRAILGNPVLREQLGMRARERARADFDIVQARCQFVELMGLPMSERAIRMAARDGVVDLDSLRDETPKAE